MNITDDNLTLTRHRKHASGWNQLRYTWYADLFRYIGQRGKKQYLHALLRNPAYSLTFLMRLCNYLSQNNNILKRIALRFFYEIFRYHAQRSCIEIDYRTKIGYGLYMPHMVSIVVHYETVIGNNCHLSQNVTIGQLNRGERKGTPTIGDNVYIGPGAVVIGKIKIGNNVAIGANSVVNQDIPDNAVAAGVPARTLSFKGSQDYIVRTDY